MLFPILRHSGWSLGAAVTLALAVLYLLGRTQKRPAATGPTWGCGFQKPTARMTYSAGGFSQLARDSLFRACLAPAENSSPVAGLFARPARFLLQSVDPVLNRFFAPLFTALAGGASACRLLQSGRMNVYLFYIFSATILLLGWVLFQLP